MSHSLPGAPGSRRLDAAAMDALRQAALENRRCSRRVRYEVRDGVAVAAFSAAASTSLTLLLTFALSRIG
ncbi:hypothetical protein [Nocardioides marmoribigeumensis]|uniref:DUF3040 domain-containing protein n=1 Tax=Nocardioides marmoribigeumensis TaxID=433649 RepID=A0ABU2BRN3_9ACTN|nr:hypothetical protein [Nocardioides marmoribigeumensis]MDR7361290.1 hypothetical protein [Nocardioides marmoribigeumensis]